MNTHKCAPRLAHCYWHPRWKVTRADPSKRRFPWTAWTPFLGRGGAGDRAFRTHAEAIAYATAQAHAETTTATKENK